jgi:hypothetical protein
VHPLKYYRDVSSIFFDREEYTYRLGVAPDEINGAVNIGAFVVLVSSFVSGEQSVLPADEGTGIESNMLAIDAASKGNIA